KRELREELPPTPDGTPRFPERPVLAVPVTYPDDERRAHELLDRYAELRRSHHTSGSKRSASDFVTLLLQKRLLSSPSAFANPRTQHCATIAGRNSDHDGPSERQLQAAWDRTSDEVSDDEDGELVAEALTTPSRGAPPLTAEERSLLDDLAGWAEAHRN